MGAACVHEDSATAAISLKINNIHQKITAKNEEEEGSRIIKGKRKADTSPESNNESIGLENVSFRRPNKTRVVTVQETTTMLPEEEEYNIYSKDLEEGVEEKCVPAEGESHSSSPGNATKIIKSIRKKGKEEEEKDTRVLAMDKLAVDRIEKMTKKINRLNKSINKDNMNNKYKSMIIDSETEYERRMKRPHPLILQSMVNKEK